MKKHFIRLILLALIFNSSMIYAFSPPKANKIPFNYKMFNFDFTNHYQWLEDINSLETLNWSKSSHQYTVDYINSNYSEIIGLKVELRKNIDRDYRSAPFIKAAGSSSGQKSKKNSKINYTQ